MTDSRPSPASGSSALQRRAFRPWAFAGWVLVGALWGFCFASAFSFGLFVMPLALIGLVWMCLGYTRPEGWPGAIGGMGLIGCYLAFLHRNGPGRVCTGSGAAAHCTDLLSPWPLLAGGIVLIAVCGAVSWRWYTRLIIPRYRR